MEGKAYQDAAFYCDGTGHTFVVAVEGPRQALNVYCDGQMRVRVNGEWDHPMEPNTILRTTQELFDHNITEESHLDGLEWENNPWFAVYAADGTEVFIEHTLDGAVAEAARALVER